MDNIRKKYSAYVISANYTKDDFELCGRLNLTGSNAAKRLNKIAATNEYNAVIQKPDSTSFSKIKDKNTKRDIPISPDKAQAHCRGAYQIQAKSKEKIYGLAEVCLPDPRVFEYMTLLKDMLWNLLN